MSHEERPNFLKILEDIRNSPEKVANTSTGNNEYINWSQKTKEEIVEDIRQAADELFQRGLIMTPEKCQQYQLKVIKSLEEWHSGRIKPFYDPVITIGSILYREHIPAPDLSEREQFAKASKSIWHSMKDTIHDYITPFMEKLRTQSRIIELENILLKHPNRSYVKAELIKLKKTIKPKIGRKKKRK